MLIDKVDIMYIEEPTTIAGYDMANDFIKQMIKMKLVKEEELKVLTAVAKRINDYVKHETVVSLSSATTGAKGTA